MGKSIVIRNARMINPFSEAECDILIENGKVNEIGKGISLQGVHEVIDASGRLVFPGFIDVHIHGAGGYDTLDEDKDAVKALSEVCVRFGVTGFLATTLYKPGGENKHIDVILKGVSEGLEGASMLGLHMEGPFISPMKRGAIQESSICKPSEEVLSKILKNCRGWLRMMTIAPELEGSHAVIRRLLEIGVIPSFGHSAAPHKETLESIRIGVKHVTHLFNTMNPLHHRDPGPLIAIFESKEVTVQLISDGVHVHPSIVSFASRILGDDRIILITDGVRSLGMPDGRYVYDGIEYTTVNGTGYLEDGTLVGNALGLNELAKRFWSFTGFPLTSIAKVTSYNSAKLLGLDDRKGSIEVGKDADIVVMDTEFNVLHTFVMGELVFSRD
ncbi:MAG: N-acetylglucosamine-6-phosphate deacetylase [Thermoproteota archaeon]